MQQLWFFPSRGQAVGRAFLRKCIPIIGDNLLYFFGVAFLSWKVFDLLLLFWVENLVLGVFGLQRLLLGRRPDFFRRLYAALFYVLGLAVFTLVFGLFAWIEISGLNVPGDREASLLAMELVLIQPPVLIFTAILAGFQFYDLIFGYLVSGRFRWINAEWEMRHVGLRLPILTVGLMVGGGLLRNYGSPVPALFLVVLLKIAVELGFAWNNELLEAEAQAAQAAAGQ